MADDAVFSAPAHFLSAEGALEHAFEAALPECTALAFRVAFSVLRQREDAEDVAQEVLAKAFRGLRSLRDPARLRPWLVRAAFRRALDHRRGGARRGRREERAAPPSLAATSVSAELQARMFEALDALPEKLRLVIVLSAFDGYDTREVASLLRVPEGTVKSRLHSARKALSEGLR